MNVLFLDQYTDPGGGQQCLRKVVRAALARGWEVRAALPGDGALGVPVSTITCGPFASGRKTGADIVRFLGQLPVQVRQLHALIRAWRPDLLYVNGPRLVPAACASAGEIPVLFHCHSLLAREHAWIVNRSLDLARRSLVIAGSRYVAAPFARRKPRIVYNGVADHSAPRPTRSHPRIGLIGRIAPEKGQLEFVRAVRLMAKEDAQFVICGDPLFGDKAAAAYCRVVKRESEGLPVEFLSWRPDVRDVLSELDILVVPSPGAESTSLVILEAYSARVPVIAFASGGIPEVVEHGVTGILVSPPTPEALADALRDALTGPAALGAMADRARQRWQERFTEAAFTMQILESIEDLAAPRHAVGVPLPVSGS
jgi:glycosyltransferase involved in cell wall biosynthesis